MSVYLHTLPVFHPPRTWKFGAFSSGDYVTHYATRPNVELGVECDTSCNNIMESPETLGSHACNV